MNATNFNTNKDFRKNIDIRQKMRHGEKGKKIILPDDNFVYGMPNRPPTPFKEVINNAYGNRAEEIIRNEYDNFIAEKTKFYHRPPKVVPRFISKKVEEMKKRDEERKKNDLDTPLEEIEKEMKNQKPLYKLKMFQDVGSKVAEGIKQFKTYHPYKKHQFTECAKDSNIDNLINKVQGEINEQNQIKQGPVAA